MPKPRPIIPVAVGQVRRDPDPRRNEYTRDVTITGLGASSFYGGRHDYPSVWITRNGRKSRIAVRRIERWAVVNGEPAPGTTSTLTIETQQESGGRWIAEIPAMPGCHVYGATRWEAVKRVVELAAEVGRDG